MMRIDSDRDRGVVRIAFVGHVSSVHFRARAAECDALLAKMGPGFTLLTDLTELGEMELDCVADLTRLMDRCLGGGVAGIIRVIPDPDKDIGFHLLSMTHYRGRVPITTCPSREEAERALFRLSS